MIRDNLNFLKLLLTIKGLPFSDKPLMYYPYLGSDSHVPFYDVIKYTFTSINFFRTTVKLNMVRSLPKTWNGNIFLRRF